MSSFAPIPPPTGELTPTLPAIAPGSPAVVRVFDQMRRELEDDDTLDEFCWFARE